MYLDKLDKVNMSNDSINDNGESRRVLLMNVKNGVSLINVISMLLVLANTMMVATFIFFSSVYFLQSPTYFGLEKDVSASVAGDLIFYSYPACMIFQFLSGYFYSILGRKWTIFIGFTICSIVVVYTPIYIKTIYPGLLLST
jgi:hypothetical protein